MACDICGKTGTSLEDLKSGFETDDIKQICPECAKIVNRHVSKIREMNHSLLKRMMRMFMSNKKKEFES